MPAKLTIPTAINVNTQNTTLPFTSTNNGYLETNNMHLNGSQLVIDQTKKYYVGLSVAFEQNGSGVSNTINAQVLRNGNNILSNTLSYNVNDECTVNNAAYLQLSAGDVITVNVNFAQLSQNQIWILPKPYSTFLNVV